MGSMMYYEVNQNTEERKRENVCYTLTIKYFALNVCIYSQEILYMQLC